MLLYLVCAKSPIEATLAQNSKEWACLAQSQNERKTNNDKQIFMTVFHAMLTHIGSSFNDVTQQEGVTLMKSDILSRNFESPNYRAQICNEIHV